MTGLIQNLTELTGIAYATLWGAALVFLRLGAMMALMPAFGDQVVPMRVRLAITLAFTAVVYPAVAPGLSEVPPGDIRAILTEVVDVWGPSDVYGVNADFPADAPAESAWWSPARACAAARSPRARSSVPAR